MGLNRSHNLRKSFLIFRLTVLPAVHAVVEMNHVEPCFVEHQRKYSDTSMLPTPVFFYGMEPGEEISVDIEPGKTLIVKFLTVGDPHPDGTPA